MRRRKHRKPPIWRSWESMYKLIKRRVFRPVQWRFETLYNKMNKVYLKKDLTKDYIHINDVKEILDDENIRNFPNYQTLKNKNYLRPIVSMTGTSQINYYSTEDIKDELLRRECVCWKDYALYRKELYCQVKQKRNRAKQTKTVIEKVVLVFNGQEYTLGKFNQKLVPKLDRIIKEIYAHKDLFDPNNPNYISPRNLTYIGKKITVKNIDTIDPIQTLLDSPLKW